MISFCISPYLCATSNCSKMFPIFITWFHMKLLKRRKKPKWKVENTSDCFPFLQTAIHHKSPGFITTALLRDTWVTGVKSKPFSAHVQPFIKPVSFYLITTETVKYCLAGYMSEKILSWLKSLWQLLISSKTFFVYR